MAPTGFLPRSQTSLTGLVAAGSCGKKETSEPETCRGHRYSDTISPPYRDMAAPQSVRAGMACVPAMLRYPISRRDPRREATSWLRDGFFSRRSEISGPPTVDIQ
ncbi:predicted protein [Chaetomium globosum CBS 148.51]|uniref:Uncharacterized protein n=1 Tax=Chaetomium globosum (strain ATCC 6205 / CBS 148.51 / DSM 1962 / NBRC 6347 / NRRL 1970) TaxID=306901 RepID=Q2HAY9_CHAGB|nr:uncharacterized protein CHGG_02615 [Chaetomium globosum CBS 148.51]EAQ90680.1 predicted protein [Chaetomium globosum CBS 148.51]